MRTLTLLDFLRTSFGETQDENSNRSNLGLCSVLVFYGPKWVNGIGYHINTRTCIKFTRFQFTDALEDEKSGSHLSYPISTPNMGYWALKLGTKWEVRIRTVDMGKQGTKLVFSLKMLLKRVSPPVWICNGCSSSSLNMKDLSEVDPANLLHWYQFHESFFSLYYAYTQIGDETGFRGSNYGLKTR